MQSQTYHNFSDSAPCFNIPNFWNVISNLPFLIVGLWGLLKLDSIAKNKLQYFILFLGVTLISLGSGYYHLNPNDETLIWDRLPMTLAFMSLFSIIISEFISIKLGRFILFPTLMLGLFSVWYWGFSDDLKLYVLVQSLPILAMPFILIFYKPKYTLTIGYWFLLITYLLAKVVEYFDDEIFALTGVIGGHPIKHMLAAIGIALLLLTYLKRKKCV